MSNGANPYVTRVSLIDGQIVLTVQVDEFPIGVSVEISGYATQNGGAFATFYDINSVTENSDGTAAIYVKARPVQPFKKGDPVTVVLRVARVWATVLTESAGQYSPPDPSTPAPAAPDGTTWDVIQAVTEVSANVWSTGSADQRSTGDVSLAQPGGPTEAKA